MQIKTKRTTSQKGDDGLCLLGWTPCRRASKSGEHTSLWWTFPNTHMSPARPSEMRTDTSCYKEDGKESWNQLGVWLTFLAFYGWMIDDRCIVCTCRKEKAAPSDTSIVMSPSTSWTFPDFLICSLPINPSEKSDRTGTLSLTVASC